MSCDVIGHVTALDQSDPSIQLPPCRPPSGETALDQSESTKNLLIWAIIGGLYSGAPGGNKRTTNQNAPFQPIRMSPKSAHF